MAEFTFTSPEGKKYKVNGPDGATHEEAFKILQQHLGAQSEAKPEDTKEEPSVLKDVALQVPTGLNEGLADTVGAPVDAVNWGLKKLGLPVSENPFLGSAMIKQGMGLIGANPDNAPAQTGPGQFARSAGNAVSSAVLPEAALAGVARAGVAVPQVAKAILGDGSNIGHTAASAAAAGLGSEAAGQATEGTGLEPVARMAGGIGAGGLAGLAAAKLAAQKPVPSMSIEDVERAKNLNYNDPVLKQLSINKSVANNAGADIAQKLEDRGFFKEDHAPVFNAINRLTNAPYDRTLDHVDAVRQALSEQANQLNEGRPTPTASAAMKAKQHLDNWIDGLTPNEVSAGDPNLAIAKLKEARANAGAAIRADQFDKKLNNALIDANTANNGMNVQNKVRQAFKPLLKNDEAKMGGYNDAEKAAVRKLVLGSDASNAVRVAGNLLGGGLGVVAGAHLLYGHPLAPVLGFAAKKLANAYTKHQADKVTQLLLSRAPAMAHINAQNAAIKASNTAAQSTSIAHANRAAAIAALLKRNAP